MKKYIILGIITIFSVILLYQTYSIYTIKGDLENIKNMNMSLQEEVSFLSNEISSQIQSTLNEELGKSYLTKDVNFNLNKNTNEGYNLTVRVDLSEIKENSKVLFLYSNINTKDWKELELKKDGELSYIGDFNLLYENNYEYKIIIKGDKIESSDVEDLGKSLFMPSSPDVSWNYNESGIYFSAYPYIEDESESSLNKNKIKTIEVLLNNKEKTYKCKLKKEDSYDEDNMINDTHEYYEVEIPKDAYNGKLNSIKMKVTYTSGIIDIQDVTNNQSK